MSALQNKISRKKESAAGKKRSIQAGSSSQTEENPQIQNFESAGFLVRGIDWNGFTRDYHQCEGIWKDFFPINSWQGDRKYDIMK